MNLTSKKEKKSKDHLSMSNENEISHLYPHIEFSNILRDIAQVKTEQVIKSKPLKLVSLNSTDRSLTWMLGRLNHTVVAEKYQVEDKLPHMKESI